ncbi:MAG: DUF916 and DUF3324 domain-containing protein [Streptococcaceae bacterium]|jgi:LPXTG-motif cell wall-anchored protein|nr:DUF916 and DUF3324 domain-containing protein [Streptococcaceae bacterium]
MKRIKTFLIIFIFSFVGIVGWQKVSANDQIGFSVNAILPKNQANPDSSYFDLLMTPGQKQTVQVQLGNSSNQEVIVEIASASATTNINGVVEYSPNDIKADARLKFDAAKLITPPKEIKLPPMKTIVVDIPVQMPNESFKGVIAGGLTFKKKADSTQVSQEKGVSVNNLYQFVVGILMRQEKGDISPDLVMNSVGPGQVNYRNVINANLQNKAMGYLNDMKVEAVIQGVDNKALKYTFANENMKMAPNTNFDLPIPVSKQGALGDGEFSQPLEPGKYEVSMIVYGQLDKAGQYKVKNLKGEEVSFRYKWTFTGDFTIAGAKAAELNAKDVTIKKDNSWIMWAIIIGLLALIVFLLLFLLFKKRKKDDENKEIK